MKTTTHFALWPAIVLAALVPVVSQTFQVAAPVQGPARSATTIPSDITSYGGIFVQARINNAPPMWFYLDSGASSAFFIDVRRARMLGLKLEDRVLRGGGAGPNTYESALTRGVSISLGALTFKDESAAVMALASIEEQIGRPLDGLVGIGLFVRYVVEIDYAGKKVRLYDPLTYTYSGKGECIPLTLRDGHFFIPATIEMPGRPSLNGQFLLDTGGCMVTAILTTPFAQSNNLPATPQKRILDRSLSGLGGETQFLVSRALSFTIGTSVIRAPLIYMSEDKGGALASSEYDGVIGTEILRRFKMIFDYRHGRLILERNAHYYEPVEYDMSGISFRAYGDHLRTFRIYQVLENTPAAEAGLRVGDELLSVDDTAAIGLTLEKIIQMLKVPGREYKLSIRRAREIFSVKLRTRRLI